MAQVEVQCLPFGQGGCKNEKQENKSTLLRYQIFDVNLREAHPRDSQGWLTMILEE